MTMPKIGDLVTLKVSTSLGVPGGTLVTRGYHKFPGEWDYHRTAWVGEGRGILLEFRDDFIKVFIHGSTLWFEKDKVKPL